MKKKKEPIKKEETAKPLRGFISTGILFIGDPGNLAGNLNDPAVLEDRGRETRKDNPFYDYENFLDKLDGRDKSLPYVGGFEANDGMGVAIQLGHGSGKYHVHKEMDAQGNVTRIIVDVLP